MNPKLGDIRREWDWVKKGIQEIFEQFPWLEYRVEDVYASCITGNAVLYITEEGFTVFTIEEHPVTLEKTYLCWVAWKKEGNDLVAKHFDFFCKEAKKLNCKKLGVKTPIDKLEKILTQTGWRCNMRDFSINITEEKEV